MSQTAVRICVHRPGKSEQILFENLVTVDELRLRTFRQLSGEGLIKFRSVWVQAGLLSHECDLAAVRKTLFFQQNFQVMELLDQNGRRLGMYCDISSPLVDDTTQYHFTDWFLDVWISPEGAFRVLDGDEFEQAYREGLLNSKEYQDAQASLAFLVNEIEAGRFPDAWLGA